MAESLGSHLAVSGYGVVNGGYSGTMEAVSKGAASVGGVTVRYHIAHLVSIILG